MAEATAEAILYGSLAPGEGAIKAAAIAAAWDEATASLEFIGSISEAFLGALHHAGKPMAFLDWDKKAGIISGDEDDKWWEFQKVREELVACDMIDIQDPDPSMKDKDHLWKLTIRGQAAAQVLIEKYRGWRTIQT